MTNSNDNAYWVTQSPVSGGKFYGRDKYGWCGYLRATELEAQEDNVTHARAVGRSNPREGYWVVGGSAKCHPGEQFYAHHKWGWSGPLRDTLLSAHNDIQNHETAHEGGPEEKSALDRVIQELGKLATEQYDAERDRLSRAGTRQAAGRAFDKARSLVEEAAKEGKINYLEGRQDEMRAIVKGLGLGTCFDSADALVAWVNQGRDKLREVEQAKSEMMYCKECSDEKAKYRACYWCEGCGNHNYPFGKPPEHPAPVADYARIELRTLARLLTAAAANVEQKSIQEIGEGQGATGDQLNAARLDGRIETLRKVAGQLGVTGGIEGEIDALMRDSKNLHLMEERALQPREADEDLGAWRRWAFARVGPRRRCSDLRDELDQALGLDYKSVEAGSMVWTGDGLERVTTVNNDGDKVWVDGYELDSFDVELDRQDDVDSSQVGDKAEPLPEIELPKDRCCRWDTMGRLYWKNHEGDECHTSTENGLDLDSRIASGVNYRVDTPLDIAEVMIRRVKRDKESQ